MFFPHPPWRWLGQQSGQPPLRQPGQGHHVHSVQQPRVPGRSDAYPLTSLLLGSRAKPRLNFKEPKTGGERSKLNTRAEGGVDRCGTRCTHSMTREEAENDPGGACRSPDNRRFQVPSTIAASTPQRRLSRPSIRPTSSSTLKGESLRKAAAKPGESGERIMRRGGLRGSRRPRRRFCA